VHPFPTEKTNIPARAAAFGAFTVLATATALARRAAPDGVLSMSPPLTMGPSGWLSAARFSVPLVFNIQDVFPDVAIELGVLRNAAIISCAQAMERFSYRRADAVTVLSDDLAENVRDKLGRDAYTRRGLDRVRVIPNFVDTASIRPQPTENAYRSEFGLGGKRVVMYAGNVGLSQSLDLVLSAAAALAHEDDVVFVINGGGSGLADLQARARGADNVRFVPMQPKERLAEVLAAADIHLVPLKAGLARSSVPSKLYSILAAGRPVVASVDRGTEVERTLDRAGAGISVEPNQPESFTKAISRLLQNRDEAEAMGRSGRRFVEGWASPAAVVAAYEALFAELVRR
jgi:colanic acid biosynthesis glycosyl transferase WcaI